MEDDPDIQIIQTSRPSRIGRVRTCWSLNFSEWFTIGVVMLGILFGISFNIYRFSVVELGSPDFVLGILVVINLLFGTAYLIHGIFQEQPLEMATLALTISLVWILHLINYFTGITINPLIREVRLIVASGFALIINCLVLRLGKEYWDSGNLVFKTVGGQIRLQKICRQLFIAYSLMALDIQAWISCLILGFQTGFSNATAEQIFFITFGTIYAGIWLTIGYFAMKKEHLRLTWFFGISSFLQPLYIVYLFQEALTMEVTNVKYSVLSVSTYVATVAYIISHFSLLAMTVIVAQNYGNGLRQKVYGGTPEENAGINSSTETEVPNENQPTDPLLPPENEPTPNYDSIPTEP